MRNSFVIACLCLSVAASAADQPTSIRAFYFGNSLTGCTDPFDHPKLVEPLGLTWEVDISIGAGWQLWQHARVVLAGEELDTGNKGDLTIDPKLVGRAKGVQRNFLNKPWDVMVLQPFEQSLSYTTDKMWGDQFAEPMDTGDIACGSALIEAFLERNPEGRVGIYTNWPVMKSGTVPDELPAWAIAYQEQKGKKVRTAEFPDREAFDYEQEWLGKRYDPSQPDKPWLSNVRTQDFHYQLFEAYKERFPRLWESGRLVMIPVGDVWMALHKKAQAGEFDGIADIDEFYTDVQHTRVGLPRYSAAATFFTMLFNRPPHELNWQAYNDPANYTEDPNHDKGEHFPINETRAQIVHDTIMEVVTGHPYTRM